MSPAALRRRYLSLGLGEWAATVVLGGYWWLSLRRYQDVAPVEIAALALGVLLAQGGTYWLLARQWVPGGRMPAAVSASYRLLRWLNIALLAAALIGLAWSYPGASGAGRVCGVLVWLFAVAEYVNYFWIRLSYPVTVWLSGVRAWRPSRLARDLARS